MGTPPGKQRRERKRRKRGACSCAARRTKCRMVSGDTNPQAARLSRRVAEMVPVGEMSYATSFFWTCATNVGMEGTNSACNWGNPDAIALISRYAPRITARVLYSAGKGSSATGSASNFSANLCAPIFRSNT
eukprot:scaffold279011_cov28-Tisochrysis_lutea.AAC.4